MDRNNPFDSMERLFDQMRRSMMGDTTVRGSMTPVSGSMGLPSGDSEMTVRNPGVGREELLAGPTGSHVTLERTDDGFVAIADLPGFERDELTVSIDDGLLRIDGVHEASEDDETTYRHHSRRASETVRVPEGIDLEAVSATYRNGILEISLPTLETPDDAHVIDIE
jgi:HSP20 family protein